MNELPAAFTLTAAERARAREIVRADPTAIEAAVFAALGHLEDVNERMLRVLEGVRRCEF